MASLLTPLLHFSQINNDASSSKPEGQTTSDTHVNGNLVGEEDGKEEKTVPTSNVSDIPNVSVPDGNTAC